MLLQLQITNFALVDRLTMEFGPGLNILTGETGAGKSVLIDALNTVLGERAGAELIRTGSDRAIVEAAFDISGLPETRARLADAGFEDDEGTLLLARELAAGGRNLCRINGRMATVAALKQIGQRLVDIHGQHEHQSLLAVERHLDLLDRLAGSDLSALREKMTDRYAELRARRSELAKLQTDARERARMLDLYQFQVQEIDAARLSPGEEEELMADRVRLANAEKLHASAASALESLEDGEGSALDRLRAAASQADSIAALDAEISTLSESLSSLLYTAEDLAHELRAYQDKVEFNPDRLATIEERVDLIRGLKKKYGNDIEEILAYRDQTAEQVDALSNSEERSEELVAEIARLESACGKIAADLTKLRKAAAAKFEKAVVEGLSELAMEKTRFRVSIEPGELGERGGDRVEFLISPNPGEPLKPLAKIASGGEMSRIMLALKTLLAKVDGVPTLVFDEIDAGIGGRTANSVGAKLAKLGGECQVLCVTHLAQIAGLAATHFSIEKGARDNRTVTTVTRLEGEDRVRELARMLGATGDSTAAVQHARELLAGA